MSFKKTLILLIVLLILIGIAYVLKSPKKKTIEETELFPDFDAEKVISVYIHGEQNTLTLSREGEKWIVVDKDGLPADPVQVKQAIETLSQIKTDNVVSRNPSKQEIFQVDPNTGLEVEVRGEGDRIFAHLFIGKNGPDFMSTYVRRSDSDNVILHRGFHLRSRFDKSIENWLNKTVTNISAEDISRIEFDQGDQPYSLVNTEGKWHMEAPEDSEVREDVTKDMISSLTGMRATDLQRLKPENSLEEFGLDKPQITISVFLKDGASKKIYVGKQDEKGDKYFIMLSDEDDIIYAVGKYTIDKINKPWKDVKQETVTPAMPETQEPSLNPNMITP